MTNIQFSVVSDEGQVVELTPSFIRPFGAIDVATAKPLKLEVYGTDAVIDGVAVPGHAHLRAKISFSQPATIYSLVPDGWLRMPFVTPPRFLVDRNVVIRLRQIREGNKVQDAESLLWWTQCFAQSSTFFNPLPYAFEAEFCRKPTYSEFVEAFQDGVSELRAAFPQSRIVEYDEAGFVAAYAQLEAFDRHTEAEVRFLLEAAPRVAFRPKASDRWKVAKEVAELASQFGVGRTSIVYSAVLSCVLEDIHGGTPSIGKKVLKPRPSYSEEAAFNALSDIRHFEIAAQGQAFFGNESIAFCTCDKPLVQLWSALNLSGEKAADGSIGLNFSLNNDFFQMLTIGNIETLKALICE